MDTIYENHNFLNVCEFLPNHLYFVTVQNINNGGSCEAVIPNTEDIHFFNTDNELIYHNFYGDFGPLSITCLYKFCKKLTNKLASFAGEPFYEKFVNSRFGRKFAAEKLQGKFVKKKIIVYYTSTNNEKRANAGFLISAFSILYLGFDPKQAYKALQPMKMRYRPFQDASVGLSPYKISMKNCLDALHKASIFGFFNFNDFNVAECSHYENIEHGDLNWIIPQKFVAFPGPVEEKNDYYHHPYFYVEYFLCNNVTDVIRLNQRAYDPKCFTMFNIKHHDLFMQDGSDPPDCILKTFLHIAETAAGAIAVHCKAGLGRTGSLIGAYLIKHYRMTAKEAIAWIRICRPGSVVGHQQTWLEAHEEYLWYEGNEWRYRMYGKKEIVPFLQHGIYSMTAPKKEFPGLRELLSNLTKRSRYRFIVKNRTKKSKTKLQQVIKNLLENGKSTGKDKTKQPKETEAPAEVPSTDKVPKIDSQPVQIPEESQSIESKDVEYLKPPPKMVEEKEVQPFNYEYSQLEYRKPLPIKSQNLEEYNYNMSTNYQRVMDYLNPPYNSVNNGFDTKLQAMYSNPHSFYSSSNYADNEYSNKMYETRAYPSRVQQMRPPDVSAIYSDPTSPGKYEKKDRNFSKSIDKNWKQNSSNNQVRGAELSNRNSQMKSMTSSVPSSNIAKQSDEICAFDTRIDTISQYSRFNKPYLNRGYLDGSMTNSNYALETKLKSYDYTKIPERPSHNRFLLSPEDLQSWVETFNEKTIAETPGNSQFTMKRSSLI